MPSSTPSRKRALLLDRLRGLGMAVDEVLAHGRRSVRQIDPAEVLPSQFANLVRESVEGGGASVVVIDSLNGYLNAMPEERALNLQLHALLSYLGNHGVATFLVAAQSGMLGGAGIAAVVGRDWAQVDTLIHEGAGALMVTDVVLTDPGFATLLHALDSQPPWSNLPVLALCRQDRQTLAREAGLRNLTVLERPTASLVMLSAVMTALRGRRWQYQIRY